MYKEELGKKKKKKEELAITNALERNPDEHARLFARERCQSSPQARRNLAAPPPWETVMVTELRLAGSHETCSRRKLDPATSGMVALVYRPQSGF